MQPKEVKAWINRRVRYLGVEYRFTAYIYRQDKNGNPVYQAELEDLKAARSVRICQLEDVEGMEK